MPGLYIAAEMEAAGVCTTFCCFQIYTRVNPGKHVFEVISDAIVNLLKQKPKL